MQLTDFQSLYSHRELLWAWTVRTVRARYQQSALGVLWTIFQPVAQVAIFTLIFTRIVPVDTGDVPYPVFNFAAMVPWLFFSMALTDMVTALVVNMNLVTKIYFPREILPAAAMLARFLDFLISLVILAVLILLFGLPIYPLGWLFVPVIAVVQMAFTMGIGLIGAALNVFYRDIQHIFTLVLRIWFYACPIIYPVDRIPEAYRTLYFLNPMSGILEAYRAVLLNGQMPDATLGTAAIVSFVLLAAGYWFFKRVEFQFADVV
ncbi:MAG: ABC transporter permease [Anaerolineales bacterium]|nr:ABC transporter permease [Anaerolineales bacterium]